MSTYFARSDEDREFDEGIRDAVKKSKSRVHMAMYLQGQEQLNLLRRLVVEQQEMKEDIRTVMDLVNKKQVVEEQYDLYIDEEMVAEMLAKPVQKFERKLDDLIQYICESGEFTTSEKPAEDDFYEDAIALIHIRSNKASEAYKQDPSILNARKMLLWDYILCCVTHCNED